jgi:hypothetical protein
MELISQHLRVTEAGDTQLRGPAKSQTPKQQIATTTRSLCLAVFAMFHESHCLQSTMTSFRDS